MVETRQSDLKMIKLTSQAHKNITKSSFISILKKNLKFGKLYRKILRFETIALKLPSSLLIAITCFIAATLGSVGSKKNNSLC